MGTSIPLSGGLTPNTVYISDNAFGEKDLWVPFSGLSDIALPDKPDSGTRPLSIEHVAPNVNGIGHQPAGSNRVRLTSRQPSAGR